MKIKLLKHSKELLQELSELALTYNVFKELGYPVYSDENHTWVLAYNDSKLVGFCAYVEKKSHIALQHDYVSEGYRNNGIYNQMFNKRLESCSGLIKAAATKKSIGTFIRNGFKVVRKTRNYYFVELEK